MSRLIVKNLPKNVTETKLKELFSQKGVVTDVQLKYTKEGKFRRFCFIGFKTEEETQAAKEYFDKTCIDTSRISVDLCSTLGDSSKPKSWSKYAPDSSSHKKTHKDENETIVEDVKVKNIKNKKKEKTENNEIKEVLNKHKDDPLFLEFLESHKAGGVKKIWDNDILIKDEDTSETTIKQPKEEEEEKEDNGNTENNNKIKEEEEEEEKDEKMKIANKFISDSEYMEFLKKSKSSLEESKIQEQNTSKHGPLKLFTIKIQGLGYNHKKKDIKKFFAPLKAKSIRIPGKVKGIAYVGFEMEQHLKKALTKNKSFIDGKQIFVMKYEDRNDEGTKNNESTNYCNAKWQKQEEALKDEESIAESGRIFIRNLSYATTEDDIQKLFEIYGLISEINLPVDKITRKLKGFGTVTFMMPEHAVKAYSELDGSIFNGRMLHLLPGKTNTTLAEILQNDDHLGFKEKKDLKTKITANSSHNWNTLFLGQNAVLDTMASTFNVTKEQVLEDGSKSMTAAVKLALGETRIVQETQNFLEEHGVHLNAFNLPPKQRSKTVIVVKNLPAQATVEDIRNLFVKYGELGRLVVPPSGITALIEFLEPSEARKAFTQLAYTKFKNLPLYLEWAPDDTFIPNHKSERIKSVNTSDGSTEKMEIVKDNEEGIMKENNGDDGDDDDAPESNTTLYVKNLNFSTNEDQLKNYFSKCGPVDYVTIATKKCPKVPGNKLSMGYGFVRYKKKSDTDRALKELQLTELDGKQLELKRSERILSSDVKTNKKISRIKEQTGTKILVRNIPFQASQDEVTELFKAYGELKAVRLPKKFMGIEKHRGFGFVEYFTKAAAKKAFKALGQSTHLYGRKLVLEWTKSEESVEDIRKRTAKHFYQDISSKKSKKGTVDFEPTEDSAME